GRGVPAEFAALVRKMMAKDPADRYGSAAELRGDLVRWGNPELVRKLVGAAAETGQAFRPPPPELDDSELQIETESLRSLGSDEPLEAPLRRAAPLARTRPAEPAVRAAEPARPAPLQRTRAKEPREPKESLGGLYVAVAVILALGLLAMV